MKKSAKALTFAAAAMAAGIAVSGCWNGFGGNVYGPPPSSDTTKDTKVTDVTVPSTYDPTTEQEVDVYGPPPDEPD